MGNIRAAITGINAFLPEYKLTNEASNIKGKR